MGGIEGTGQNILTSENIINGNISNTNEESDDTSTRQNSNSSCTPSDLMTAISRARSDSSAINGQVNTAVVGGGGGCSTTDNRLTVGQNTKIPVFRSGYLNNGKTQTRFPSTQSTQSLPTEQAGDSDENMVLQANEDEALLIENGIVIKNADEKNMDLKSCNQKSCISTTVNNNITVNNSVNTDDKMEISCKLHQIIDKKPETLDVLAKNAINANGLSQECVKIIHPSESKMDLKEIAQELTTTFKPVESAM